MNSENPTNTEQWLQTWETNRALVNCPQCEWLLLAPPDSSLQRCPHCGCTELEPLDEKTDQPAYTQPPELVVPYRLSPEQARSKLAAFAKGAHFAPADLTATQLQQRLRPIYLPVWLVDADIQAQWQAEAGYNYQVVSHKEKFQQNRWHTQEVKETRIRWEPRLGTLTRQYHNQSAPALEEQPLIDRRLGKSGQREPEPYAPEQIDKAWVRLPNRPPEDAWPDAQLGLQQRAATECQQAVVSDHIRQFKWAAEFANTHWTQQLYPMYTSFYVDDEGKTHGLYIHGENGRFSGRRVASMGKAKRWALGIGIAAGIIFALSIFLLLLALLFPPVGVLAIVGFFVGCVTAFVAIIPIIMAYTANNAAENKQALNLIGNQISSPSAQ